MTLFKERLPFSPIVSRPGLQLPDGARVAVWTIVNVEDWNPGRAMPRQVLPAPTGQPMIPDLPNWAWHEYGMRVGFWRIHAMLNSLGIVPTLATNGVVGTTYPQVWEAARDSGWEFMGHGYHQRPMHHTDDQRRVIHDTVAAIREFTGKPPRGWESPGLTETGETLDLLAEAGIEYLADWPLDDQPVRLKTRSGSIVSVPYTVETNDIVMYALQDHASDEILKRGIDQFDQFYKEGATIPRVMAISLHPYISGAPHRQKYLEELFRYVQSKPDVKIWKGEEVLDWFVSEEARLARAAE